MTCHAVLQQHIISNAMVAIEGKLMASAAKCKTFKTYLVRNVAWNVVLHYTFAFICGCCSHSGAKIMGQSLRCHVFESQELHRDVHVHCVDACMFRQLPLRLLGKQAHHQD